MDSVGAGTPEAVTVKVSADPTLNVTVLALVMEGPWLTVRVKFWTASGSVPLEAVKVSG
jgi:hypothetical protein